MPILKLNDGLKLDRSMEPVDQFEMMLAGLGDSKWDWREKTVTRTLIPVAADVLMEPGVHYHRNYIEYLTNCWACHFSPVIEPNHVWYTLLCELSLRVKSDPETYRHIFTESKENQTIVIPADGVGLGIDLDLLISELSKKVPTDTAAFFPDFSTNSPRSRVAKYAAFAEMASPYYNYMVLACGFPSIDVRGTRNDWKLVADKWRALAAIFGTHPEWFGRVNAMLGCCVDFWDRAEWWKEIYHNKTCGSGSEVLVDGWFAELFCEKCELPKPGNFPSHVATVEYKRVDPLSVARFAAKHGIFYSREEDGFLVPDFGHFLFNIADEPQVFAPELRKKRSGGEGLVYHSESIVHRLEPENLVSSKM